MRPALRENPFQTRAGARPPALAGRDTELALAGAKLDSLSRGQRPSQGLLLYGPRGNGKTVLLDRIAGEARSRGLRAESLPASAFRDHQALSDELREFAGLAGSQITGAQAAGFGVSIEPGSPTRSLSRLLAMWIESDPAPLVILLDEVHTVGADIGRDFFGAVQTATTRELPFWLLTAGTPDAPRRLRQAGTFTERMFEQIPVGRLERNATVRALSAPARDAGLPLSNDAVEILAAESQDYPYFIQLLGSAAWTAADNANANGITEACARRGIAAARPHVDRFYGQRLHEARGRGVHHALAPLAALVTEHGGQLDHGQLDRFLAETAGEEGEAELLYTLTDLGVLWETPPAGWEMGIPSFADFLLAHHRRN